MHRFVLFPFCFRVKESKLSRCRSSEPGSESPGFLSQVSSLAEFSVQNSLHGLGCANFPESFTFYLLQKNLSTFSKAVPVPERGRDAAEEAAVQPEMLADPSWASGMLVAIHSDGGAFYCSDRTIGRGNPRA